MLYAIKDTKYQAEGYTVAWFDEEPDFHKEWVNTPAADGVIELELSVDQFRDFKLTKLEDATEGFEENKNSQMYFISSIGYKFSGDRRTKDNLKEKIEYFDFLSADTNGVKTVKLLMARTFTILKLLTEISLMKQRQLQQSRQFLLIFQC